ncbi:BTAD domain-containing putative transcriptional regulator [Sphaerisporangium sp. B11E5]|uniref:AfsR/SARP family transcriptional regulator n=1 Tax=Sphaerisporangium sp. B11E5 TaxID=3153563 RepID=UPI00325E2D9A
MSIQVLGLIQLVDAQGRQYKLAGGSQRRLLAALAASPGHPVPSSVLVEELWNETPPVRPLPALHNLVSRLRRLLVSTSPDGTDPIQTHPLGYVLQADGAVLDSVRFESLVREASLPATSPAARVVLLRRALALWRGDAFSGLSDVPSVSGQATRLEEMRCQAVEALAAALIAETRFGEAVTVLETFVHAYPFREQARGSLVEALYRAGRQTDALAHLRGYRKLLADELGLEPSAILRDLEIAMLRQELGASVPAAVPPDPGPASYPRVAQRLSAAGDRLFAGRARELRVLREATRPADPVVLVYLHGPAGIGKTALLAAARRQAPALEWITVEGTGVRAAPERFLEAVAGRIAAPATVEGVADGLARRGAGVLVIESMEHLSGLESWLRTEFLPALPTRWTTILSGREAPDASWSIAPEWWDMMRTVRLGPFSEEESTAYLENVGVEPDRVPLLRSATGGYPLALALAAAAPRDGGPPSGAAVLPVSVAESIVAAIRQGLTREQRHVLEAASMVERVTEPLLGAMVRDEGLDAAYAWDLLRALPVTDETVRLYDVVRDSVARIVSINDPQRAARYRARAAAHLMRSRGQAARAVQAVQVEAAPGRGRAFPAASGWLAPAVQRRDIGRVPPRHPLRRPRPGEHDLDLPPLVPLGGGRPVTGEDRKRDQQHRGGRGDPDGELVV